MADRFLHVVDTSEEILRFWIEGGEVLLWVEKVREGQFVCRPIPEEAARTLLAWLKEQFPEP